MVREKIIFDRFEIPVLKGLNYLLDETKPTTDYLFINEPHEKFSMYFESGQKPFEISDRAIKNGDYCLLEMKRQNKSLHFYCPERLIGKGAVMWYFYVQFFAEDGGLFVLPGQIRVVMPDGCFRYADGKAKFIEVLDNIKVTKAYA